MSPAVSWMTRFAWISDKERLQLFQRLRNLRQAPAKLEWLGPNGGNRRPRVSYASYG